MLILELSKPSAVNKTLVEVYNAIVGGGTSDKGF
jgi:molybdopterin-containing oxidoreductase family iron-sulfur binding subunit